MAAMDGFGSTPDVQTMAPCMAEVGHDLTVAIAWCVALKRTLAVSSAAPVYGMRHCKPKIVSDSQFAWEIASK
jgi:hypothetical protein